MYLIRENFQRHKTRILFETINQVKENVSSRNNVRLLSKTVNIDVKQEFSGK